MKPDEPLVEIDLSEPAGHAARQLATALGFTAGGQASLPLLPPGSREFASGSMT
jgi:hypothetical protein